MTLRTTLLSIGLLAGSLAAQEPDAPAAAQSDETVEV